MTETKPCICEGNKALREIAHMRELARKACALENYGLPENAPIIVYVLLKKGDTYKFTSEENYRVTDGEIVEYIYP